MALTGFRCVSPVRSWKKKKPKENERRWNLFLAISFQNRPLRQTGSNKSCIMYNISISVSSLFVTLICLSVIGEFFFVEKYQPIQQISAFLMDVFIFYAQGHKEYVSFNRFVIMLIFWEKFKLIVQKRALQNIEEQIILHSRKLRS